MKRLLKALGVALGLSLPVWAAPTSGPAGNFIINNSTSAQSTMQQFQVQGGTVTANLYIPYLTAGQCATITSGGRVISTPCGSGAASIAVTTGSASGFNSIASSPTAVINFDSNTFTATLEGGATVYIGLLNPFLTTSSATATYLQLSSATATYLQSSSATVTYLQLSSATAYYVNVSTVLTVAHGGTGTPSPGLVAGTNITSITGSWPNQTINAASGAFLGLSSSGNPILLSSAVFLGGTNVTLSQSGSTITIAATGGSGGASSLEVFSGNIRSSPTASIALNPSDFSSLIHGSTFYIALNASTTDFYSPLNPDPNAGKVSLSSGVFGVLPSSGVTLISSGIAFGSATNTVTQDTNTLTWNETSKTLLIGGAIDIGIPANYGSTGKRLKFNSANNGTAGDFTLTQEGNSNSRNSIDFNDYQELNYAYMDMGNDANYGFSIQHSSCSPTATSCTPTIRWAADPAGGHTLYNWTGTSILIASAPLNNSQFVKTNAGQQLVSYDLLNATQTWTGGNIYSSSSTFNGTVLISSGLLANGSAGSNGQVLTSGGANTTPTWTTVSGGGGGASSLEVFSGPTRSSPTPSINLNSADFSSLIHGSTYYIALNASTTDFYSPLNPSPIGPISLSTGVYGTLPSTGVVLISSGVAFGSVTNTVTQDTAAFTYTMKTGLVVSTVTVSSATITSINTGAIYDSGVTNDQVCIAGSGGLIQSNSHIQTQVSNGSSYPYSSSLIRLQVNDTGGDIYGIQSVMAGSLGSPGGLAAGSFVASGSGGAGYGVYANSTANTSIGYAVYATATSNSTNYALYAANGHINDQELSTSQFVKTDSGDNLASYDLLNTTQTWTGEQILTSSAALHSSTLTSQCATWDATGNLGGTGSACGSGGGSSGQVSLSSGVFGVLPSTGIPSDVAYNDKENNWSHAQTSQSSWTITTSSGASIAGTIVNLSTGNGVVNGYENASSTSQVVTQSMQLYQAANQILCPIDEFNTTGFKQFQLQTTGEMDHYATSGQAADIEEWWNSSVQEAGYVDSAGGFHWTGTAAFPTPGNFYNGTVSAGAFYRSNPNATGQLVSFDLLNTTYTRTGEEIVSSTAAIHSTSLTSQCATWDSTGNLNGTGSACGSGGGGGSAFSLALTTGGPNSFSGTAISSSASTTEILFDSATTNGKLISGGTYFFTLNAASVTLQGALPTLLGTVTQGTWNGTALTSTYLPKDVVYNDNAPSATFTSSVTVAAPGGFISSYIISTNTIVSSNAVTVQNGYSLNLQNAGNNAGVSINNPGGQTNGYILMSAGAIGVNITNQLTVVGSATVTSGGLSVTATGTPQYIASFSTASTAQPLVNISTQPAVLPSDYELTLTSAATTSMVVGIQASGHIVSSGTVPTMGTCGTSPSVVGTDMAGMITIGSGIVTSCALTFANTWANAPVCVESDNSTSVTADITSISTTGITFGFSATLGGGNLWYICFGQKG